MTKAVSANSGLHNVITRQNSEVKLTQSDQDQKFSLLPKNCQPEEGLEGGILGQGFQDMINLDQPDHAYGFGELGVLGLQSPVSYNALSQAVELQDDIAFSFDKPVSNLEGLVGNLPLSKLSKKDATASVSIKSKTSVQNVVNMRASVPVMPTNLGFVAATKASIIAENIQSAEPIECELAELFTDGAETPEVKRIEAILQSPKSAQSSSVQLAVYTIEHGLRVYARLANLTGDEAEDVKQTIDSVLREYGIVDAQTDVETFSLGENFKTKSVLERRT